MATFNSSYTINDTGAGAQVGKGCQLTWVLDIISGGTRDDAALGWNDPATELRNFVSTSANADSGFSSTTDATWKITGIQFEIGAKATPFEHRSYGDELLRCQRYCYRVQGATGDSKGLGVGLARASGTIRCIVNLPTTMRANEQNVTESGLNCMYRTFTTSVSMTSSQNEAKNAVVLTLDADSGTPFTAGDSIILRVSNDSTAFFQVESEF